MIQINIQPHIFTSDVSHCMSSAQLNLKCTYTLLTIKIACILFQNLKCAFGPLNWNKKYKRYNGFTEHTKSRVYKIYSIFYLGRPFFVNLTFFTSDTKVNDYKSKNCHTIQFLVFRVM